MRTIRSCNVAVIGGAGFLGSHLVDHLIEDRGCRVWVVDDFSVGKEEFVHKDAKIVYWDITGSEDQTRRIFEGNKIQFVLNYAAMPFVPDSVKRPLKVMNVNCFGALKIINAAQEAGVEGILQVSSAEVFGQGYSPPGLDPEEATRTNLKIREDAPVFPHSSYGVAKSAIDYMVQVRWKEARTPCIALRQFNACGERELHDYVVPTIISQLNKYRDESEGFPGALGPLKIWLGNNSARDFMYAGDAVRMAVELLEHGQFGDVYNLGSESSIRIHDLAKRILEIMYPVEEVGVRRMVIEEDESRKRPWEIWSLLANNSKIYSVIPSRPMISLDEALRRTIKWYQDQGCKWPWEKK